MKKADRRVDQIGELGNRSRPEQDFDFGLQHGHKSYIASGGRLTQFQIECGQSGLDFVEP
jgi:hypothetical protein